MTIHDVYRPFQRHFRARRMAQFARLFAPTEATRIVDVGGYEHNWTLLDAKPHVELVNIDGIAAERGRFHTVRGDGRALPYADHSFDIAYSNSVIEHVGGPADRAAFARQIRRIAPRYYVQTPNRWFPVEPHFITVGIHLAPPSAMRRLVRWASVWGWIERPDQARIDDVIDSIHLLDRDELARLFPDAEILEEKVLGLTKSLIAVRC